MAAEHLVGRRPAVRLGRQLRRRARPRGLRARAADLRGELSGGPRRGDPQLRPEPGQLHPRGYRLRPRRRIELAGVFYHQSRHLATGPRRGRSTGTCSAAACGGSSAWRAGDLRRARRPARVFMKIVRRLPWELDAGVRSRRRRLRPADRRRWRHVDVRYLGVDGSRDRGNQTGYSAEGGVRFEGRRARSSCSWPPSGGSTRIRSSSARRTWVTAGFRLLSRRSCER